MTDYDYDYIVMGGTGLVGSSFVSELSSSGAKVLSLTSQNFDLYCSKNISSKFFINANGNSYRYKANKNPFWDFDKSVYSLIKSLKCFTSEKYIYFSSVDVYDDKRSPDNNQESAIINPRGLDYYGYNKFVAENILEKYHENCLVLRLGSVVSALAKKGPFYDLSQNQLYIDKNSKLSVIDIENIHKAFFVLERNNLSNQTFNLTGTGSVSIKHVVEKYNIDVAFRGSSETAGLSSYDISTKKLSEIVELESSIEIADKFFKSIK